MREGGRVFLVPEVEWDDAERAWVDALRQYRDDVLCPCGCGWPKAITLDPMTEFNLDVPEPVRCWVSSRLGTRQEEWRRDHPDASAAGLLWSARLRSGVTEQVTA